MSVQRQLFLGLSFGTRCKTNRQNTDCHHALKAPLVHTGRLEAQYAHQVRSTQPCLDRMPCTHADHRTCVRQVGVDMIPMMMENDFKARVSLHAIPPTRNFCGVVSR